MLMTVWDYSILGFDEAEKNDVEALPLKMFYRSNVRQQKNINFMEIESFLEVVFLNMENSCFLA